LYGRFVEENSCLVALVLWCFVPFDEGGCKGMPPPLPRSGRRKLLLPLEFLCVLRVLCGEIIPG
ncbi:MAG: hypothetical protein AAB069_05630, partial [Planctomycetota bacterium]